MKLELLTQKPDPQTHPIPILFVHGAWHAAWCWEEFMPYFAAQGWDCYALSLRGHGGSDGRLRWASGVEFAPPAPRRYANVGSWRGGRQGIFRPRG